MRLRLQIREFSSVRTLATLGNNPCTTGEKALSYTRVDTYALACDSTYKSSLI
jgi:hypothetical protein